MDDKIKSFSSIIKKYWEEQQIEMVIEECSELIQALQKFKRLQKWYYSEKSDIILNNLKEEIADTQFSIEILLYILSKNLNINIYNEIENIKTNKINRALDNT